MITPKSQADRRRDLNPEDQFGRLYLVAFDKETMEPTGAIDTAGWSDPLKTPQKYIHVARGKFKTPDMSRMVIDFTGWIKDQSNAFQEWRQQLWGWGSKRYADKFTWETAEEDPTLIALAGPKPWPSHEALKIAAKGPINEDAKALLGLGPMTAAVREMLGIAPDDDGTVPETMQKVGENQTVNVNKGLAEYHAFHAEQKKLGKSKQEISLAWKEHKQERLATV